MLKRFVSKIIVESPPQEKRPLVNAYNQECFFVHDGPVLGNLDDLLRSLRYMSVSQYEYHANGEKNDFALWVREVLRDDDCANALLKAKDAKRAAAVVERRLKDYYV